MLENAKCACTHVSAVSEMLPYARILPSVKNLVSVCAHQAKLNSHSEERTTRDEYIFVINAAVLCYVPSLFSLAAAY